MMPGRVSGKDEKGMGRLGQSALSLQGDGTGTRCVRGHSG